MRVLVVHNSYRQPGGEDAVAATEAALLRQHGHAAMQYRVSNAGISGVFGIARAGLQCSYSTAARDSVRDVIQRFGPSVVHVHNFFPLLSPSIYDACRDEGVPVVQTLHNYRLICPGALLLRNGATCEKCVTGSAYRAVAHGCYRNSPLSTLPVAHMVQTHRRRATWTEKVDRFVALTNFAKAKFVEGGLPAERITVKPNSLLRTPVASRPSPNAPPSALFVGRLSVEKGVGTLAVAWRQLQVPLVVVGEGPMRDQLQGGGYGHVRLLGQSPAQVVTRHMQAATFVVLPSICYEGFPMALLEAYAHARPVIASRIGALAELVTDHETGLLCEPGDAEDLVAKVRWAAEHPDAMRGMGLRAREVFDREYTADANYARLSAIYRSVQPDTGEPDLLAPTS